VRKPRRRVEPSFAAAAAADDDDFEDAPRRHSRADLIFGVLLLLAAGAVATNALFLQKGPHPAPFFSTKPPRIVALPPSPLAAPAIAPDQTGSVMLPRPRPLEAAPDKIEPPQPVARSQTDIVIDIQKELGRRGFYDGVADGVYGPKTDGAIRDFMQAAALKIPADPSEALLRAIARAPNVKAPAAPAADAPRPPDPIAEFIAPPKRVIAVQRVLADFGYGQLKPTGVLDRDTQAAIEQFERSRKLPVTGQVTPRLMRELAAMSGRPLE
jgi:peptidoglycan hydrolase-like protein with peptidoglycan-binding domain